MGCATIRITEDEAPGAVGLHLLGSLQLEPFLVTRIDGQVLPWDAHHSRHEYQRWIPRWQLALRI